MGKISLPKINLICNWGEVVREKAQMMIKGLTNQKINQNKHF